jgi:hypothetical protein
MECKTRVVRPAPARPSVARIATVPRFDLDQRFLWLSERFFNRKDFPRIFQMKTVSHSAIPVWLLSVAILISGLHLDVAQSKDSPKKNRATVAIACGNELTNQCNGVPVHGNNMLECIQKDQAKLSKGCAALANHIVRSCERDAVQRCQQVVAGGGNILGCLTTARGSVSSGCNAALDAVFPRR